MKAVLYTPVRNLPKLKDMKPKQMFSAYNKTNNCWNVFMIFPRFPFIPSICTGSIPLLNLETGEAALGDPEEHVEVLQEVTFKQE